LKSEKSYEYVIYATNFDNLLLQAAEKNVKENMFQSQGSVKYFKCLLVMLLIDFLYTRMFLLFA